MDPFSSRTNDGARIVQSLRDRSLLHLEGGAGTSYPPCEWGIRLASGMTHWYESESKARASQYWPTVAPEGRLSRAISAAFYLYFAIRVNQWGARV